MPDDQLNPVRIVDVDMPFGSMVKFMVKWAIASIPALLILTIIGLLVGGALALVTRGVLTRFASDNTPAEFPGLVSDTSGLTPLSAAEWSLSESTDPADASPAVVLSLDASSPASTPTRDAPSLILRCSGTRTELYIDWHEYLGTDSAVVTTRTGGTAASQQSWSLSTDNEATFFPGSPVSFIEQLLDADTLVAETTPFGGSPITATFAVKGLSDRIEPLRKACGW